jgi:hypothetical protein
MSCLLTQKKKKVAVSGEKQTVRWACQYYWTLLLGWASFGLRFFLLLDSRLRFCLSPPTFLASCWSIMHFFLPDRFGLYFLYISFISLLLVGAFFFSFLFFFLRHCLKQIKPLFGSIVQTEACKNSVFLKKINFLYFFLF